MENLFRVLTGARMKTTAFRDVRPYSLKKVTDVLKVLTASMIRTIIALIMVAVSTSETSVNFYETTWRSISALPSNILYEFSISSKRFTQLDHLIFFELIILIISDSENKL
jgi:hypothetical protein